MTGLPAVHLVEGPVGAGKSTFARALAAERRLEVRRARVLARNAAPGDTFSIPIPEAMFELASRLWEPPSADECHGRDVRWVTGDFPNGSAAES